MNGNLCYHTQLLYTSFGSVSNETWMFLQMKAIEKFQFASQISCFEYIVTCLWSYPIPSRQSKLCYFKAKLLSKQSVAPNQ